MNEIKKVINATMKGPLASPSMKILIYSNMRDKTIEVGKKVEEYLETDDETFLIDVMTLHGRQTRTQKASYLDLFVSDKITLASNCKNSRMAKTRESVCHLPFLLSARDRNLQHILT